MADYTSKFTGEEIDARLEQGIPIYDDVSKLPQDATVGSLAAVAYNTIKEINFSDLYQPTVNDINTSDGSVNTNNFSSVLSIKLIKDISKLNSITKDIILGLIPRSTSNLSNFSNVIMFNIKQSGIAATIVSNNSYEMMELMTIVDNSAVINENDLDKINIALSSDDYCYLGNPMSLTVSPEQYDIINSVIKSSSGAAACNLYIKDITCFRPFEEGKTLLSQLTDDIGYLLPKDVYMNIEVYTDDKHNPKLKKNTIIINYTNKYPSFEDVLDLNEICTFGYLGSFQLDNFNAYIDWITTPPSDMSIGLCKFTYIGYGNVFVGEFYDNITPHMRNIRIYYGLTEPTNVKLMNCNPNLCGIMHLSTEYSNVFNYDIKPTQYHNHPYSNGGFYGEFLFNKIDTGYFSSNTFISEVSFYNIEYIEANSFNNCVNLYKISFYGNIPYHVRADAFLNTNINIINITDNLKTICHSSLSPIFKASNENKLFKNNIEITELKLNEIEGIEYIGICVFYNFNRLTKVIMPKSVKLIKMGAFWGCTSMRCYDFSECIEIPVIANDAFENIPDTCKIVVPDALYDNWIVAENWSTYADHIVKASEYTETQEA